jgi:hypothetical protein
MNYGRRFVAFWYDFLVGDKLELFVGPILALVVTGVVLRIGLDATVGGVLLFVLIASVVAFSVLRSVGTNWLRR